MHYEKNFGEVRYEWGVTGTKYRFQGQRSTEFDLYDFNARFFDARLGRFVQPDSVVPLASQGVQAWDRYAGLNNNPIRYIDPDGHEPQPPPNPVDFVRQVIILLENIGATIVGDPAGAKSIYANGADIVAKVTDEAGKILTVAVECKATPNVDLGTLGQSKTGTIGGSIERVVASANRFINSSNGQLKTESQAIQAANNNGTLRNALFTYGRSVSDQAQQNFNYVYKNVSNGASTAIKALPVAAAAAKNAVSSFVSSTMDVVPVVAPVELFLPYLDDPQYPY